MTDKIEKSPIDWLFEEMPEEWSASRFAKWARPKAKAMESEAELKLLKDFVRWNNNNAANYIPNSRIGRYLLYRKI